jgi:hypothetical protein
MNRLLFAIFLALFIPHAAEAQEVRAFADRTQVSLGESLQLTVSVSGGDGKADISPIRDFKVISRGTSSSVQIVNGRMSRETAENYTLIPLTEGRLKIPPLDVTVDGKVFKTEEIIIQVSKTPQQSDKRQYLFVEAQVSNTEPYEGQQIIYTFKFFVNVRLANARFQKPDFKGFTAKETVEKPEDRKSYRTVVSGREYNVTELSFVLIPMSAGEKIIEPAVLEADLMMSRRKADPFFNDPFFGGTELEPGVFKTEPIKVNVKPLPPYTGEGKFSGLVGNFDIHAFVENADINEGDSATLSITVEGTGNITDMEEPQIVVPDALKPYKDAPSEDIKIGESGYSGQKVFRTALVGVREGEYHLDQICLNYFDISKGSYQSKATIPLTIKVHPAKEKDKPQIYSAPPENGKPSKQKVEFTGRDILPLKEELDALQPQKTMTLTLFALLFFAPILICILLKAALIFSRKDDSPAVIMMRRAEKALKEASASHLSGDEFLSALYRALVSAVLSKAGTKGESLTYSEAASILQNCGYSEKTATSASDLLEKIESAKFSGVVMNETIRAELLSETRLLVRSLK